MINKKGINMKIKHVFLSAILVMVLTLTIFGQTNQTVKKRTIIKKNEVPNLLGKPVYASTTDSLNTKVWIISQSRNKEIMKTKIVKMKDKNTTMDKTTKEAMMEGSYFIILDVTNISTGKEFADTSAKVEIVSPSKKLSSANFIPMMNYFGAGVSLNEKGDYLFTINLNIGIGYKTTQFKYTLK
jgi:hypothetical protein